MKRRSLFLSLILLLVFSLPGREASRTEHPDAVPGADALNKGNLFSAILFGDTALGRCWAALRPEAEKLFPALKMKAVEDLHVTVIYIGREWSVEELPRLRRAMAVTIDETIRLRAEIANIGRSQQVVVVDLIGLPQALQDQIFTVKAELNRAGLKKPETYDAAFRPHVTLAEARDRPPSEPQALELKAFQAWIAGRLDLANLDVVLGPATPIRLLLADATRPAPLPEYIPVEKFLELYR